MFVRPGDKLYEGMVIGIHSRDNDLVVNPIKGKQLTNVRASGKDDAIKLTPPIQLTLEYAVEFIADDELVEITPKSIRIRKRHLQGARAQEGVAGGLTSRSGRRASDDRREDCGQPYSHSTRLDVAMGEGTDRSRPERIHENALRASRRDDAAASGAARAR